MNDHEAQRIAAAAHELRPDWPTTSVLTLIRKHLLDKPRRDVTVALAWVACESGTATPKRVLEPGPWWRAAAVEGSPQATLRKVEPEHRCSICSEHRDECRRRWADHEFTSVVDVARSAPATERVAAVVARARAGLAANPATRPAVTEPEPRCGPDCIRAASHTGDHLPPVLEETA